MKDEDIIKLTENEINKIERVNESFRARAEAEAKLESQKKYSARATALSLTSISRRTCAPNMTINLGKVNPFFSEFLNCNSEIGIFHAIKQGVCGY